MNLPDLTTLLFSALAILTGGCALGVVVTQNIVRAAAWLLFALGGVAGIFFFLEAPISSARRSQIDRLRWRHPGAGRLRRHAHRRKVRSLTSAPAPPSGLLSIFVGLLLFGVLGFHRSRGNFPDAARSKDPNQRVGAARPWPAWLIPDAERNSPNSTLIGHGFLGQPLGPHKISYLLPFEIVSVHLLVVLIGAAYLARAKRRRGAATNVTDVR